MSQSEIDAKSAIPYEKMEIEDVESYLEVSSMDISTRILDGPIIQNSNSKFSISISTIEYNEPASDNNFNKDKKESNLIDKIQLSLDIAGFFPMCGAVPDIINGVIYLCRGKWGDAGISFIAAIPLFGDTIAAFAKGAKYIKKGDKIINTANQTNKLGRAKIMGNVKVYDNIPLNNVADDIIKSADGKRISFLWTNNTQKDAKELASIIKSKGKNSRVLELDSMGIIMESKVDNRLIDIAIKQKGNNLTSADMDEILRDAADRKLWGKVFSDSTYAKDKAVLERYQRVVSKRYAEMIKDDYIIEVRKYGHRPGQANQAELKRLYDVGRDSVDGVYRIKEYQTSIHARDFFILPQSPKIIRDKEQIVNYN